MSYQQYPDQNAASASQPASPYAAGYDQASAYQANYAQSAAWSQYPQGQYPGMPMAPREKNFFAKLFDLSFDHFVTPSIAKVVYVICIVINALAYLAYVIVAFIASPGIGAIVLLLGWIPPLLMIILCRLGLELSVAVIKVAENTKSLKTT